MKKASDKKKKKKQEFSKAVITATMISYFSTIVFAYTYFVVLHPEESMSLDGLFTFVGAPTAIALGFYIWKAKCENIHKNPVGTNTTNTEEVYDNGTTDFDPDFSGDFGSADCTDLPDIQPEKEVHRVVKVRRIRGGKTARRRNRSA